MESLRLFFRSITTNFPFYCECRGWMAFVPPQARATKFKSARATHYANELPVHVRLLFSKLLQKQCLGNE